MKNYDTFHIEITFITLMMNGTGTEWEFKKIEVYFYYMLSSGTYLILFI